MIGWSSRATEPSGDAGGTTAEKVRLRRGASKMLGKKTLAPVEYVRVLPPTVTVREMSTVAPATAKKYVPGNISPAMVLSEVATVKPAELNTGGSWDAAQPRDQVSVEALES